MYPSSVSKTGYATWHKPKMVPEQNGLYVSLLDANSVDLNEFRSQISFFRTFLKINVPGTYSLNFQTEYFSLGNDIFPQTNVPIIMELEKGEYPLNVGSTSRRTKIKGFRDFGFAFSISLLKENNLPSIATFDDLVLDETVIAPSVVNSRLASKYIALTAKWIHLGKLNLKPIAITGVKVEANEREIPASLCNSDIILPNQVSLICISLSDTPLKGLELQVSLMYAADIEKTTNKINIKLEDCSERMFRYTYLSSDGSVQKALLKTKYPLENTAFMVIISDIQLSLSDWDSETSNIDNYWIVILERASSKMNMGDIMFLDMREALEAITLAKPKINKVAILGYSNGAKLGLWIATHYPEFVSKLCLVSGDFSPINYPPSLQLALDPDSRALLYQYSAGNLDTQLKNLQNIPILIITGENDQYNPPSYANHLAFLLSHVSVVSLYLPKYENHYFTGIINNASTLSFFNREISSEPENSFSYYTFNNFLPAPRGGISLVSPEVPHKMSSFNVKVTTFRYKITTRNVSIFRIDIENREIEHIEVDGDKLNLNQGGASIYKKSEGSWTPYDRVVTDVKFRTTLNDKPLSTIFAQGAVIVLPSNLKYSLKTYLHVAKMIADYWHTVSGGRIPIIPEQMLDRSPEENYVSKSIFTPRISNGAGPHEYNGKEISVAISFRSWIRSKTALIIAGNSENSLKRMVMYLTHGIKLYPPDFTVLLAGDHSQITYDVDKEEGTHIVPRYLTYMKESTHTRVIAAGFWSSNWTYNSETSFHIL